MKQITFVRQLDNEFEKDHAYDYNHKFKTLSLSTLVAREISILSCLMKRKHQYIIEIADILKLDENDDQLEPLYHEYSVNPKKYKILGYHIVMEYMEESLASWIDQFRIFSTQEGTLLITIYLIFCWS